MTGIRLRDIREHEGSQARAWEELAYQVRPDPQPDHVETRKTRAPDGGVEWYESYADGHQEGFQAKFNESLEDALGGMLESVKTVAAKRPDMTHLTFIVPYDFTDAASHRSKSDQDRWTDAAERWKKNVVGADRLTFNIIRGADIVDALSLKKHAGRRAYWFSELELTDSWFALRWTEAEAVAGERYTPAANTPSRIQAVLDAVCADKAFLDRVDTLITQTVTSCRHDRGMWGEDLARVGELLNTLETEHDRIFGEAGEEDSHLPTFEIDFLRIAEVAENLDAIGHNHTADVGSPGRRNLDNALSAVTSLVSFANGRLPDLYQARAVAIDGPAGQGKTHALMHSAKVMLERGVPTIVILGERVRDDNWWPVFSGVLGGIPGTSDDFLQALDSLAEARACRAVLIIDALNEAQSPRSWRSELPALLAQTQRYPHISLIVSFRTDYREVIQPPGDLRRTNHPGLAGHEAEALAAYCSFFGIPVPAHAPLDSAFTNALFLRMYCAVTAAGLGSASDPPTRTSLFARFAELQTRQIRDRLRLPPTSTIVADAIQKMADLLLAKDGRAVARSLAEPLIDAIHPGHSWPDTLFHSLVSEGVLEVRPGYDGTESVSFPFQAYSEQLLASRFLEIIEARRPGRIARVFRRRINVPQALSQQLSQEEWLWRAMSVLLPERHHGELIDLLPKHADDYRLIEATRESLVDRSASAFGSRAKTLLEERIDLQTEDWVDTVLTLSPRVAHPANSDWLHGRLKTLPMPERDASWSIATAGADEDSPGFMRLAAWADSGARAASDEQVRLAGLALMWLLTSPNRFLRDRASKSLVALLCRHLRAAVPLLASAQDSDDIYVQERMLTCVYGAIMVGGDDDIAACALIAQALEEWLDRGLPVNVLARDSARGIAAWAHSRRLVNESFVEIFSPPFGATAPVEPPTAEELGEQYGNTRDSNGDIADWRAQSILSSCLDWMGDFNKYVVKSDVGFFSLYPLSGPPPPDWYQDPNRHVEADWAGRWIAKRAIELGWTASRFGQFERSHDLTRGRDAHKAERFGKKYQWIAHHELLARLADNFHPAYESWNPVPMHYQGPWSWYGRDFDPSLPPSVRKDGSNVCTVEWANGEKWASLTSPTLDPSIPARDWVSTIDDCPTSTSMFEPTDPDGHRWIAIQRYSTWDRDNARRRGITKRELDVFFLQFSWLTPRGQGKPLYELLIDRGLSGRWMPDIGRERNQYLGEILWAPIVFTAPSRQDHTRELREHDLDARPAVETYRWEGGGLDCSLDESLDFATPTAELLGDARWVGHTAQWHDGNAVIAKAIRIDDGENGQDVLLIDPDWLDMRLRDLDAELVIGTLGEKHAQLTDDDRGRSMDWSDIWYVARIASGETPIVTSRPFINVHDSNEAS